MRANRFIELAAGVIAAAGLSLASTSSYAIPPYFQALYYAYGSQTFNVGCANCHTGGGSNIARNSYGAAFEAVATHKTDPTGAFKAVASADADGDGFSNLTELTAGSNPGDATSTPLAVTGSTAATATTTTAASTTTTTAGGTTTTIAGGTTTSTTTTTRQSTTSTTTTRPSTTTTLSTTSTTQASGQASSGAALYAGYCAGCHDGAAASGGGRQVLGARTCSINGAINGTIAFPGGVPAMNFLQGLLSAAQIQAISDFLNSGTVTGQQRYLTACAGCHGADARGGRVGQSIRGADAQNTSEAISGKRGMGFLSCLPASDVNAIGAYLKGRQ